MTALKSLVLFALVTLVSCSFNMKLCLQEIIHTTNFISTSHKMSTCETLVPDIFGRKELQKDSLFCEAATVLDNLSHVNTCPSLRKQIANIESNLRGLSKVTCTTEGFDQYVKLQEFIKSLHEFARKSYKD